MTTLADQIIESLDADPTKWQQREHTADHVNGIRVWTSNGFWFISLWTPEIRKFSILEKLKIRRALKRWQKTPIVISQAADRAQESDGRIKAMLR
jgi:Leu/Phe-tRNA-protein transferase